MPPTIGEWKEIADFPAYFVSSDGRIYSSKTKKIFCPGITRNGYVIVHLRQGGKQYARYLHRLVATAFILNPENVREVNHIDGNKQNNAVSNLEWVTSSQNKTHAYKTGITVKKSKPFYQIDHDGKIICHFRTLGEAYDKLGLRPASIRNVLVGRKSSFAGFIWRYEMEVDCVG